LFEPYPLRDNILVAPSVAHFFWKRYQEISYDERIPVCKNLTPLIYPVLRPFDKDGYNEYEYFLQMANSAKEEKIDDSIPASLAVTSTSMNITRAGSRPEPHALPFASMTVLDLSHVQFKKQQFEALARALADASEYMGESGIAQNFTIDTINISGMEYPVEDICKGLDIICSSKVPLRRIIASKIGLRKHNVQPFADALLKCSTLVEVNVSDNNLGNEGVTTILTTLADDLLDFDSFSCNNTGINDGVILQLQNVILQKKRPTRLRCANNSFGRSSAKKWGAFLALNSELRELDLGGCSFGKDAIEIVSAIDRAHNLRRLRLAGNKIGKDAVYKLAELVANGVSRLDTIDLANVPIKKGPALALLEAMTSMKSEVHNINLEGVDMPKDAGRFFEGMAKIYLNTLRLRACDLSSGALKGIAALISGSEQLTFVDLACNVMNKDSVRLVASAIGRSRSVTEFDISYCDLTTDCTLALFEVITQNTSLRTLRLCGSRISSEAPKLIANFVNSKNSVIESIDLRRCTFAEPLLASMLKALDPNAEGHSLRKLDLRGIPGLRKPALEPLFERLNNVLILM